MIPNQKSSFEISIVDVSASLAKRSSFDRILLLLAMALSWVTPTQSATLNGNLTAGLYSGLTITGAVGTVYSVEYISNASESNAWRSLDFVRLSSPTYLWVDPTPASQGRRFYRARVFDRPDLVFIPPGSFRMGSPTNEVGRQADEGPQTVVTFTKGLFMAPRKVTQTDYQWVVGTYPSVFTGDFNRPVESVDWGDATNYCAILTQRERAARLIPLDCAYRLPTEAEWEYACRAWTTTRFSYGDDPGYKSLGDYAWYLNNSGHTTHPVGVKLPNPWGLYDMHGNLWEWCQDWYGPYPGGSVVDPQGPATGTYRVFRGGSWGCTADRCRSAIRDSDPEGETGYVGFRVVLAPSVH